MRRVNSSNFRGETGSSIESREKLDPPKTTRTALSAHKHRSTFQHPTFTPVFQEDQTGKPQLTKMKTGKFAL